MSLLVCSFLLRLAVLVCLILLLSRGKTVVSSSVIPQGGTQIFITAPIIPSMTENTMHWYEVVREGCVVKREVVRC